MNKEWQRIAIAEACGWKESWVCPCGCGDARGKFGDVDIHWKTLPDYLNDLNAIHEAEKKLTDEQWTDYLNQLYHITFKPGAKDKDREAAHSTASQRAEAFLRTLGLWKE